MARETRVRTVLYTFALIITVIAVTSSFSPSVIMADSKTAFSTGSTVVAVNGSAFTVHEVKDTVKLSPIKTSIPVFKAFGLSHDRINILYTPLDNGIPSGELYIEDLQTQTLRKVTEDLVMEAALSPNNQNEIVYTFSTGDNFGLAIYNLGSGETKILVSENVLPDIVKWNASGDGISYFEAVNESQTILDPQSNAIIGTKPYTVLSSKFIDLRTGILHETLGNAPSSGFPVLKRNIFPGQFNVDTYQGEELLPNDLYAFGLLSADLTHEIYGNDILGDSAIYVRSLPSGGYKLLGKGQLLGTLKNGALLKTFTDNGSSLKFVNWNGQIKDFGATTVNYNLPLKKFTVTQVGAAYKTKCKVYTHKSGGTMQWAYDMQNSSTGAHALASADGLVVYTKTSIACNSLDTDGCQDYLKDCSSNSGWGNAVIIQHADGTYTKYTHLQKNSIQVSNKSNACQGLYIGRQGHTGASSGNMNGCGDHLHFQRQSSASLSGTSQSVSFSDAITNPLSCKSYTSGSTERSSCSSTTPTLRVDGGTSSTKSQKSTFTLTGSDYTSNGTVSRYVNGTAISSVTATSSGTLPTWSWATDCTTATGTYTVYAKDNKTGKKSNNITEIVTASSSCNPIDPKIAIMPMSGPGGTVFQETGTGFTPSSTATLYFPKYDGVNDGSTQVSIDATGNFSLAYPSGTNKPPGNYKWYAKDGPTGLVSNEITYTITVNPTIAMSPMSGHAGTLFVEWGTGFTPNSTATLYFPKYDGVHDGSAQQSIDSLGHFQINYPSGSNKPKGTYKWYAIDGPTAKKSNEVFYQIN
jgi:hypothetical protein